MFASFNSFLTSGGLPSDPNFEYNALLLNGNGTNGAQNNTFLDSSTNNFTITRNGNTTQGSFSPYGSNWSNYFNGSSSYLTTPSSAALTPGSGDFCVEFWLYWTGGANENNVIMNNATGGFNLKLSATNPANWGLENSYVGQVADFGTAPTKNSWHHIAVTRSSGTLYAFIDGTQVFSGSNSTNFSNPGTWYIGANGYSVSTYYITGYLSNLRIVVGSAVYTSSFTPSTTPLTAITNTALLTCQSNRFIDNSTNNFTITPNGTAQVQRFSPFNPTAPYSTSVIGGSGYFDGSGDNLSVASNAAFALGSGNFTVECWFYVNNTSTGMCMFENRPSNTASGINMFINYSAAGQVQYRDATGAPISSTITVSANTWNHYALVRNGSTITLWINGQSGGTVTNTTNFTDTTCVLAQDQGGGFNFAGYLSNFRIVKGTAVYTSAFTPPTAPLTAITNTSLLTNMVNAGIPDLAMMNNLETVGNAQVSTSVKKYGTGSLAFDGTGDYLTSNAPTNLNAFGTGDFTIELWVYFNFVDTQQVVLDFRSSPSDTGGALYLASNGSIRWYVQGSDRITGGTVSASTWTYIALSRSGTSTKLFINGTQSGSTFTDTFNYVCPSGRPYLGALSDGTGTLYFNGYIDDLRITKGLARYTANFTPPTAALPTY